MSRVNDNRVSHKTVAIATPSCHRKLKVTIIYIIIIRAENVFRKINLFNQCYVNINSVVILVSKKLNTYDNLYTLIHQKYNCVVIGPKDPQS